MPPTRSAPTLAASPTKTPRSPPTNRASLTAPAETRRDAAEPVSRPERSYGRAGTGCRTTRRSGDRRRRTGGKGVHSAREGTCGSGHIARGGLVAGGGTLGLAAGHFLRAERH